MKLISAFLNATFTLLILLILGTSCASQDVAAGSIGNIYVFESDGNGFNTKTVFYDDGKEVVAFDAQFTEQTALWLDSYFV